MFFGLMEELAFCIIHKGPNSLVCLDGGQVSATVLKMWLLTFANHQYRYFIGAGGRFSEVL